MQSITPSTPWYRRIRGLAQAITILLGVQIAVLAAQVLAYLSRIGLLHRVSRGEFVTRGQAQAADDRVAGFGGLWLLVFAATVVVWLVWQHRAQANAQHLTTKKLTFSPGWAVGWWFIPFANWVQPFRAVRELWQASGGTRSQPEGTWPVLVLWWAAWLGFNLIGLLGRSSTANDVHALTVADEWQLISVLLGIASAVLAVVVVRAVVRRQQSGIQAWPGAPLAIPLPPPPAPGPLPG